MFGNAVAYSEMIEIVSCTSEVEQGRLDRTNRMELGSEPNSKHENPILVSLNFQFLITNF